MLYSSELSLIDDRGEKNMKISARKLTAIFLCFILLLNLSQPAACAEERKLSEDYSAMEQEMESMEIDYAPESFPEEASDPNDASSISEAGELDLSEPYEGIFEHNHEDIKDETILYEDMERREESTKHFRLKDGSMAAFQYAYPIHEKDAEGNWREIDNRLVYERNEKGGELYRLKRQEFSAEFYAEAQDSILYRLLLKEGSLAWGLKRNDDSGKEMASKAIYTSLNDAKHASLLDSKSISGVLEYPNILPGIKLTYQLAGYDIKENLVLENTDAVKENGSSFLFVLESDGLFAQNTDEKSIEILDKEGNSVALIRAPYMMDAAGSICDGLRLEIEEEENKSQRIAVRLTADETWLLADERAYPVTVDPTLTVTYGDYGSVETSTVYSANPNATERYNISVGRNYSQDNLRAVVKLAQLPALTEADTVINASLSYVAWFYSAYASGHSGPVRINLHGLTEAVNVNTVTWNSLQGKYSSMVTDTQVIQPGEVNQNTGHAYRLKWDITRLVKEWYLSGVNHGFAMISENESASSIRYVMLYSSIGNTAPANCRPVFTLTYLNQEGVEPHLSTHSAGSATMGTVSVGDFNGNLVYTYNDLSMTVPICR